MIITISGQPGTGKSTVAKKLAMKLSFERKSSGDFQRQLANEKGISIKELADLESKDPALDKMVDERQKKFGEQYDDFVMDTWLGAKFIPHSVKIYLYADEDIRAKRIFHDKENKIRLDSEKLSNFEETKQNMVSRDNNNIERWKRYYDFDYTEKSHYDLTIDTSDIDSDEVIQKILNFIK